MVVINKERGIQGPVGTVEALPDGSPAKPALRPASNPDTGWYFYSGGERMGYSLNGENVLYINKDGALILTDVGTPLELGSGTARGTVITPSNRFYRTMLANNTSTIRLLGSNSADDIVIGGEGGAGASGSIVFRKTAEQTEFIRSGTSVLTLKAAEIDLNTVIKVRYGNAVAGGTVFLTKVEGDTSDRLEIRNNGQFIFTNGTGTTRFALSANYTRSTYTQTFATATHTNPNLTAAAVALTPPTESAFGFTKAQAESILTTINALIADLEADKKLANGMIDDLQSLGVYA